MKTGKIYDSVRHPEVAANIAVIDSLTIQVRQIRRGEVLFVVNPNIKHFRQGQSKQEIEFACTDETAFLRLTPTSPPVQVLAAGSLYNVSVAEIGAESQSGVKGALDYCVFDVTQFSGSKAE
jgi:uncharacterized protein (DUF2141 family)